MWAIPILVPVSPAQRQHCDTGKFSYVPCLSWLSFAPWAVSTLCCLPRFLTQSTFLQPSRLVSLFTSFPMHFPGVPKSQWIPPLLSPLPFMPSLWTLQSCFVDRSYMNVLIMLLCSLPPVLHHCESLVSNTMDWPWVNPLAFLHLYFLTVDMGKVTHTSGSHSDQQWTEY